MDRKSNDSSRSLIGKYGGERERERERRKTEKIFALGRLFCRRLGTRLAATPSCLWNYLRLTSPFLKKKKTPSQSIQAISILQAALAEAKANWRAARAKTAEASAAAAALKASAGEAATAASPGPAAA